MNFNATVAVLRCVNVRLSKFHPTWCHRRSLVGWVCAALIGSGRNFLWPADSPIRSPPSLRVSGSRGLPHAEKQRGRPAQTLRGRRRKRDSSNLPVAAAAHRLLQSAHPRLRLRHHCSLSFIKSAHCTRLSLHRFFIQSILPARIHSSSPGPPNLPTPQLLRLGQPSPSPRRLVARLPRLNSEYLAALCHLTAHLLYSSVHRRSSTATYTSLRSFTRE